MSRGVILLCLLFLFLLAACGGEQGLPRGTVILQSKTGTVRVDVEIAESDAARAQGLMNRTSLPADAGMLFIYERPTDTGFWMKDTQIPLSIAFMDNGGGIVGILDMEPCDVDPCPVYQPDVPYVTALEVNQGAFDRWGVEVGDRAVVDR